MADNTRAPEVIELTLVAKYDSFVVKAADILQAAVRGQWSPGTTEFIDIAKQGGSTKIFQVGDVTHFLAALQLNQDPAGKNPKPPPRQPRSLGRVNLFAHSDGGRISLHGSIRQPRGDSYLPDVSIADSQGSISADSLDRMDNQSSEQQEASRRLFAKDGVIVIYACKAGIAQDLLQRIADFFQVRVASFNGLVAFCPTADAKQVPKGTPRGSSGLFYQIGENHCERGLFDFHKLVTSAQRAPQPLPPSPTP